MEHIQKSLDEVKEMCAAQMASFQASLDKVSSKSPQAPTITTLAADFSGFRRFVMSTLASIQSQVEVLAHECDRLEMRGRQKILLIHGVPEAPIEDSKAAVMKAIEPFKLPLTPDMLSRSHRIGRQSKEKPRPVLIKFCRTEDRDTIWSSKSGLKGSGLTLSEFLTKTRHDTFLEARKRVGVSNSWTKNGVVVVAMADGKRLRVTTMGELNKICPPVISVQPATTSKGQEASAAGRSRRTRKL